MNNLFNDDQIKKDKTLSQIFHSIITDQSPFDDSNVDPTDIFPYPIYIDDSISDSINIDSIPTYAYFCDLTELAKKHNVALQSNVLNNHYMFYGLHYYKRDNHSYVKFGLLDCDSIVKNEIKGLPSVISNAYSNVYSNIPDILVDIISNHKVTDPMNIPVLEIGAMINQWGNYYTGGQFGFRYLSLLALSVLANMREGISAQSNNIIDMFLTKFESILNKNAIEIDIDAWFDPEITAPTSNKSLSLFNDISNSNLLIHSICMLNEVDLKTKTKSNWDVYSQTTPLIKSLSDITSASYSLNDMSRFNLAENIIRMFLMFLHDVLVTPSVDTFTYFDRFAHAVKHICDSILNDNNTYYNSMTSPVVIDGVLELTKLLNAFKHYILFEFDKQNISVNINDVKSMDIDSDLSIPLALTKPSDALFMERTKHDD